MPQKRYVDDDDDFEDDDDYDDDDDDGVRSDAFIFDLDVRGMDAG